jgi:iron(III) transport system substrate-binding protein
MSNIKGIFGGIIALCLVTTVSISQSVAADFETEQKTLYEAAKTEEEVVLYTSVGSDDARRMLMAFEKKYPGVETSLYRAGSGTVLEKLLSEHAAEIYTADVFLFHAVMAWSDLKKKGMLLKYESPVYDQCPKSAQDRGYTISGRTMAPFQGYNINLLPKDVVRELKTFEDWVELAEQEKYQGRFGTQDVTTGGGISNTFAILNHHGQKKGRSLYQRLFAAGLRMNPGGAAQINNLTSGQEVFDFFVPSHRLRSAMDKGAPMGVAAFADGQIIHLSPMSIYAKSQHVNAAKLLFNWWNSREGQTLLVQTVGTYSVLPDLPPPRGFPPISELNVIQVPIDQWEEIGRRTDEIRNMFDEFRR